MMKLHKVLQPTAWLDFIQAQTWKRTATEHFPSTLSWELNPIELQDWVIYFPIIYQWNQAEAWMVHLRNGLSRYIEVKQADIEQPYRGIVCVELHNKGRKKYGIVIDYSDYPMINDDALEQNSLYFKMQYRPDENRQGRVLPGGYPPKSQEIEKFLTHVRRIGDRKSYLYDVYGRFSLHVATETRRKALKMLKNQSQFHFEGGGKNVGYLRFLKEIAVSKICLNLPGNGDLCFRTIEYLAMGACIIGPKSPTELHVPLENRTHIVFTKDDMSDLLELCMYYLKHDEAREKICQNSREYYDRYLQKDQLASYYLHQIFNRCS